MSLGDFQQMLALVFNGCKWQINCFGVFLPANSSRLLLAWLTAARSVIVLEILEIILCQQSSNSHSLQAAKSMDSVDWFS